MRAVVFHDIGDIRLEEVSEPKIKEPTDAIVRLTASAICGTDLHMVRGTMPGMKPGTILGHEGVGVIDAVGVDADRPLDGPASKPSESPEGRRFESQRRKVAPEQHPDGENWKPGSGPTQAIEWAVKSVAKAGTIGVIGVYPQTIQSFPLGLAMNKNLTLNMGNCNHRRYLPHLLDLVQTGAVDPLKILTQREPLANVLDAYRAFDTRQPGWIKVELKPAEELALA